MTGPENETIDRRGFAKRALAAVAACFGALFGVPAAATLVDPALRPRRARWRDVGAATDLAEGGFLRLVYEVRAGWEKRKEVAFVFRRGGEVRALSGRCTHLGCIVRPDDRGFLCPCHQGRFSPEGEALSGPVVDPLPRLPTRERDGRIEVLA